MSGRAGIKDVAALAGVSIKTVSRVVNAAETVSPERRARVEAAIAQLGYVPNSAARSLKSGAGQWIGVLVDSIDDVYFASLVSEVEECALERGLSVIVASTGFDTARESDQLLRMAGRNVRGLILAPVGDDQTFLVEQGTALPVVTVDRSVEEFDSVTTDDYAAAVSGVECLLRSGHRRLAFVGLDDRLQTSRRRHRGYLDALAAAGVPADPALSPQVPHRAEAVRPVVDSLLALDDPPTALFVSNARHATAVVALLHAIDRKDLAMVSFGNFDLADAVTPAVTCIDQHPRSIGRRAFERLTAHFVDADLPVLHQVVESTLVQRDSDSIPAAPGTVSIRGRSTR
ncbi:LacI family DNA-binding transcriptional regulator [Tsukamurella soli]|uniref:LacI family DNA-binding transcriptional regulator n=1 Tax=Tsukamurella soli TaxID=644556 RepID=A0ABP8J908_9ACTN